jgi:phosphoribosylformylglycinamidine cyclo-ligase
MIVVVDPAQADAVVAAFGREGETVSRLGEIVAAEGEARVIYNGALDLRS